jgi:two-component system, OmpR family, sensor kinase
MLSRWSLRTRLVFGVVLVAAVGLLAVNVVAALFLKSYLINQVDKDLVNVSHARTVDQLQSQACGPGPYVVTQVPTSGTMTTLCTGTLASGLPGPKLSGYTSAQLQAMGSRPFQTSALAPGPPYRSLTVGTYGNAPGQVLGVVVLSASLKSELQTLHKFEFTLMLVSLGVLILIGVIAQLVVRFGLKPLGKVEETAGAIAAGDLSQRVPEAPETTEVGKLAASLNTMLGQIESAFAEREDSDRRLRQFVADASHELRTPLTSIRGYAELMRRGALPDPDAQVRAIDRIESESTRMGALVDDMLLLARLDQHRPLNREPVELVDIVIDTVGDAHVRDSERTIDLDAPRSSVRVLGDADRLRQVVANLVQNALIHTPDGTSVHVLVDAADERTAEIVVKDEGQGMPPEAAARVFERFYRGDPGRTRATGGTGLGLSIVDAVVRAHGGRVRCESVEGEGTSFIVTLPLAVEDGSGPTLSQADRVAVEQTPLADSEIESDATREEIVG